MKYGEELIQRIIE